MSFGDAGAAESAPAAEALSRAVAISRSPMRQPPGTSHLKCHSAELTLTACHSSAAVRSAGRVRLLLSSVLVPLCSDPSTSSSSFTANSFRTSQLCATAATTISGVGRETIDAVKCSFTSNGLLVRTVSSEGSPNDLMIWNALCGTTWSDRQSRVLNSMTTGVARPLRSSRTV
jgi:hypothetical protein